MTSHLILTFHNGQAPVNLIKTPSVILVLAILVTIGTLGYVFASPKMGDKFTEFYIIGPERQTAGYVKELPEGEEGKILLGIINQEREVVSYRLEVRIQDVLDSEVEGLTLKHGEKWEGEVSFIPDVTVMVAKVEFLLYKQGQTEAYRMLRLWVDLTE